MNKYLLIDKPKGWTSFDVVAKIRNGYRQKIDGKRVKVGHAGTLDPFATGLLIILVGEATKQQDAFMKLDKEYVATLHLGKTSSTGDPEGEIQQLTHKDSESPTLEVINKVLENFIGEIKQVPPIHSAIKVEGQRAYKLARAGIEVELKPRDVKIYEIKVIDYKYPKLKIRVSCSSGTYIRSLARDIGEELEVGAYLVELKRTKIGKYNLVDAKKVEEAITDID